MRSPNVERNHESSFTELLSMFHFISDRSSSLPLKGEYKVDWVAIQTTFDDLHLNISFSVLNGLLL